MTEVRKHESVSRLASSVALRIADSMARSDDPHYVLAVPSGRSAIPVMSAFVNEVRERRLDLRRLVLVALDSYVEVTPSGPRNIPIESPQSAHRFLTEHGLDPLNAVSDCSLRMSAANVLVPDASRPEEMERKLREKGGVHFAILASGASDGHVGFNGPGSSEHSRTRIVELGPLTRSDNLVTYPTFGDLENVPRFGVTLGIANLAESREATLVLHGRDKALAYRRTLARAGYSPDWPSSVVHLVNASAIDVDFEASRG
ncbi:6-phosphogluconolactonase [Salinibacterium soli]|uniref:6-phosphogluconolactonase n=1 Tax=Antiquaquibacter soli TaxID=3064523 RepID=A0ABT9BSR6_9MICO|nr:6-phosphogluconolactonase [Protaetiibacter sp. WY-16]MDO7882445.1 6-phosphogluconolactonase [Protaetiibacter sp. WY-16]